MGLALGIKGVALRKNGTVCKKIHNTDKVRKWEKRWTEAQRKLSRNYTQNKAKKRGESCYFNKRQKQICRMQTFHHLANRIVENFYLFARWQTNTYQKLWQKKVLSILELLNEMWRIWHWMTSCQSLLLSSKLGSFGHKKVAWTL